MPSPPTLVKYGRDPGKNRHPPVPLHYSPLSAILQIVTNLGFD